MLKSLNPRVVLLVLTVFLLLSVTRSTGSQEQIHRALYACGILFILYVGIFVWPLRRAVRASTLIAMAASLLAAWAATALALIADALPIAADEQQLHHPSNWARAAFVIAAGIAFYLFYDIATRGYEAREEMRVTGRRPD